MLFPFLNLDRMPLQGYQCRSCDKPPEAHVHCYTHHQGSLTISVRKLTEFVLSGERDGKIWMWHRCLKCPWSNGFPPATQRIVMSDAAWGLSLGKFLELSFSNHAAASRVASCGHSLHRDCLRFYGWAIFSCFILLDLDSRRKKYTWVPMKPISLPLVVYLYVILNFQKRHGLIRIPCIWMVLVHPCSSGFMSMLISKSLIKNDHNLPKYNAMGILVSDLFCSLYTGLAKWLLASDMLLLGFILFTYHLINLILVTSPWIGYKRKQTRCVT